MKNSGESIVGIDSNNHNVNNNFVTGNQKSQQKYVQKIDYKKSSSFSKEQ